ncbi:MAG: hypothetical protein Q7T50_08715 [Candidatus Magasanikbacteria bacterium]|nr:hypothetical protein [Candidatus Magasanikbacteria bacterium]
MPITEYFLECPKYPDTGSGRQKTLPRFAVNIISDKNKIPSTTANQPTIDIATAQIFYSPLAKKYDLIAHIQTDSVIGRMDFTSTQNLYTQVTMLKKLLTANGRLFLQTYNQDNPTINFAANNNYEAFYKEELAQRKLLSYPPFSLLVKLTIKGKNRDKIQKEAEQMATNLQSSLNNEPSTINLPAGKASHQPITILGPYESIFWQKIPTYHIILKINLESYNLDIRQKAIESLKKLTETIPKIWQIEVEPDSIQ